MSYDYLGMLREAFESMDVAKQESDYFLNNRLSSSEKRDLKDFYHSLMRDVDWKDLFNPMGLLEKDFFELLQSKKRYQRIIVLLPCHHLISAACLINPRIRRNDISIIKIMGYRWEREFGKESEVQDIVREYFHEDDTPDDVK
jgi:hypothetical protein